MVRIPAAKAGCMVTSATRSPFNSTVRPSRKPRTYSSPLRVILPPSSRLFSAPRGAASSFVDVVDLILTTRSHWWIERYETPTPISIAGPEFCGPESGTTNLGPSGALLRHLGSSREGERACDSPYAYRRAGLLHSRRVLPGRR